MADKSAPKGKLPELEEVDSTRTAATTSETPPLAPSQILRKKSKVSGPKKVFNKLKTFLSALYFPSKKGSFLFLLRLVCYGVLWILIGQIEYRGKRLGTHLHESISSSKMQSALAPYSIFLNGTLEKLGFPTNAQLPQAEDASNRVKNSLKNFKELQKERRSVLQELERQSN